MSTYDQTTQSITGIAITACFTLLRGALGGAYEVTTDANNVALSTKKYYSIAGMTVAMNDGSGANGLQYLLTDHLGSVVAVTDANGTLTSQQRYLPFGQVRTDLNGPRITNTDFGYTGQRNNSYIKLDDYKSRWYSDQLGRFISPDSIVPDPSNPQSFNRYSYVLNNPIRYTDPTGHRNCEEDGYNCPGDHISPCVPCTRPATRPAQGPNPVPDYHTIVDQMTQSLMKSVCRNMMGSSSAANSVCSSAGWTSAGNGFKSALSSVNTTQKDDMAQIIANGLDFVSKVGGVANALKWVHYPIVGPILDTASQLSSDSGKGYTYMQEGARVGIHVLEGWGSSSVGVLVGGTNAIPGAITGPGDAVIFGASYLGASALTGLALNQLNGTIINFIPSAADYIPYEPVP